MARRWTKIELSNLALMVGRRFSSSTIARILGRTPTSVRQKAWERGCLWRRVPLQRWLEILSRPHTIRGAAAEAGASRQAVSRAKWRLRQKGYRIAAAIREKESVSSESRETGL